MSGLIGRGIRYVRKFGAEQLYIKIKERRLQNKLEAPYSDWLKKQSVSSAEADEKMTFSILVPTYETPKEFLVQMAESVLHQTYPNVELCIADGSKTDLVYNTLCEMDVKLMPAEDNIVDRESSDAGSGRKEKAFVPGVIRYVRLKENKGIAENTNGALALAKGSYIGLLDHDDVLFPDALAEVVLAAKKDPEAECFYTDEDKVSFDLTTHFQPHFKPDFNLEYLRSNNYICHFFTVKTALAREVGGFGGEYDGAQDHDFILKCTEKAAKTVHIPKILYSWRSHASSTATNPESKLYAYEAGKRAVRAHLERLGVKAEVTDTSNYGFYRVKYDLIDSSELKDRQKGADVVYYNRVRNKIVTFSEEKSDRKDAASDYVLFVRSERCKIDDSSLLELMANASREDVGIVCARVYDTKKKLADEIDMKGVNHLFLSPVKGLKQGYMGYMHRVCLQQEVEEPTSCFMMKRALCEEIFDKRSELTVSELSEEVRKAGRKIVYDPWAVIYE